MQNTQGEVKQGEVKFVVLFSMKVLFLTVTLCSPNFLDQALSIKKSACKQFQKQVSGWPVFESCMPESCYFVLFKLLYRRLILTFLLFIKQDDMLMGQFCIASFCIYEQREYDFKIQITYNSVFIYEIKYKDN